MLICECTFVLAMQLSDLSMQRKLRLREFRKRDIVVSVSVFLSLCLSYTHINRITTFLLLKGCLRSYVHLLIFQLRRACWGCSVPNKYLLNWKLHLCRCLICPVSVGLIINGTASQNVSHSLGYKFSSLQTLQNVFKQNRFCSTPVRWWHEVIEPRYSSMEPKSSE